MFDIPEDPSDHAHCDSDSESSEIVNKYRAYGPCRLEVLALVMLVLLSMLKRDCLAYTEQYQALNVIKGARSNQRGRQTLCSPIAKLVPFHQLGNNDSSSHC